MRKTNESNLRKNGRHARFTITAYINAIMNAVSNRFANLGICTDTTRAIMIGRMTMIKIENVGVVGWEEK